MIAGNKCDLYNKVVDDESARKFAKGVNSEFVPTSAKTGAGV